MAAPENGVVAEEISDHQYADDDPKSPELYSTLQPTFVSWPGKRKKSKPMRYGFSQDTLSSPKRKTVVHDPSTGLSSAETNSAMKRIKTSAQSSAAVLRAREVQSNLGSEHPTCMKLLVGSYVTTALMSLPTTFCKSHLPTNDTTLVLEDEDGEQFDLKYIAYKCRLSVGWRKFALAHNLLEGDVLIFQLIEPLRFKVYIIRGDGQEDADDGGIRLNLEAHSEQTTTVNNTEMTMSLPKSKKQKSLALIEVQNKQNVPAAPSEPVPPSQVSSHPIEHSGNNSEEVGSEVLESSRSFKPSLSFQEVKTFEDFSVVVNGQCIDSELPVEVQKDYYELCMAKKELLHGAVPDGLYYKLVAGMIGEIVNIANEIKSCKINTPKEKFEAWDNSLKSFELLGMKVEFLRDRINALVKLAFESEERLCVNKYLGNKEDKKHLDDEIEELEERLEELRGISGALEMLTSTLEERVENFELKFKQEADAPW